MSWYFAGGGQFTGFRASSLVGSSWTIAAWCYPDWTIVVSGNDMWGPVALCNTFHPAGTYKNQHAGHWYPWLGTPGGEAQPGWTTLDDAVQDNNFPSAMGSYGMNPGYWMWYRMTNNSTRRSSCASVNTWDWGAGDSTTLSTTTTMNGFLLGTVAGHVSGQFRGWVAEVAVWDRPLSDENIRRVVEQHVPANYVRPDALRGYWPCRENTGATIPNQAPDGVAWTLTSSGTVTWSNTVVPPAPQAEYRLRTITPRT